MKYIDLHLHLDGSLPPETVLKMAGMSGVELPADTAEGLRPYLTVEPDCTSLNEYLEKFSLPISLMQDPDCLELAVYDVLQNISSQGVVYAEIRFAPGSHCSHGLTQEQVIAAAVSGLEKGMEDFDIRAQLICCCMRGEDNREENLETVRAAAKFRGRGVCCIDLAGAEALFPTSSFGYIFEEADRLRVPFVIHAGEADGPESVRAALKFGARRIGHGIHSVYDPELVMELAQQQIPLEICVTSNLQTKGVSGLLEHPVRTLLEQGVAVTLNTDNMTVSDTTLAAEFRLVQTAFHTTSAQIRQLQENAVNAAFLSEWEKEDLRKVLWAESQ